jgi:flagellar protein FliL
MAAKREEEVGALKVEEARAAPASSRKMLWIGILAGLFALALGGGLFAWLGLPGASSSSEGQGGKAVAAPAEVITPLSLDPFVVNLLDTEGIRYLKVKLDLDVSGIDKATVDRHNPKIRDSIIILLSSKRYDEIASIEGKLRLREEIEYRLAQILGQQTVHRVYFTDFVVQ